MTGRKGAAAMLLAAVLLTAAPCRAAEVPQVSAAAWIVYDAGSGRVLAEHEAMQRRSIASTTKIMTALVALEQGKPDETVTVKPEHRKEGSSMYLRSGEEVTLEALLYGLLLASGNDAAECIAAHCGGTVEQFVARMNEKAAQLGMTETQFQNPSGLDAQGHYSCARDMAVLAAHALEQPALARIVSTVSATVGGRTFENHNKLLRRSEGCIGLKTGYTGDAGRTLVTACERGGLRLVCVTLGDGNDWADHEALYAWAFGEFAPVCAVRAGECHATVTVENGALGAVEAAAARSLVCAVRADEEVRVYAETDASVRAPVRAGDKLGEVCVTVDEAEIARVPLYAAADIDAAQEAQDDGLGILARIWRRIMTGE